MKSQPIFETNRRDFLRHAVLVAGLGGLPGVSGAAAAKEEPAVTPDSPSAYLCLGPDQAAFVEALVTVMCPPDNLTPGGVECGLAIFMDRQLAGAFGQGERLYRRGPWRPGIPEDGYQLPLSPEQLFKAGIAAADAGCRREFGLPFAGLKPEQADGFLHAVAEGKVKDERLPLADWFNDLVYPLFIQACFADPIYGGNANKIFWQAIGYPGLPAINGLNIVKYRGKPFPAAHSPKSIEDCS